MARIRSPNYPAISLPAAVDRARVIHKAEGKAAAPREAIVKHLGFSTLNGASATMLSAIAKYGLLEGAEGGEARITDLAMRIMFPHEMEEGRTAIREAAFRPALFSEIREKWPDRNPTPESLRPFLVRKGFSEAALNQVIQVYRETLDMVGDDVGAQSETQKPNIKEIRVADSPLAPQSSVGAPPALVAGRPFTVSFDGDVLTGSIALRTVRDIERLIKVLSAQKAAMEAMQEDEQNDYDVDLAADLQRERRDEDDAQSH